ncbi:MAG: PD40 domain-containing protein [Actinobacteria bacterium]|nr:PD40 domain-containing protein [Actinomycetota bacterium]
MARRARTHLGLAAAALLLAALPAGAREAAVASRDGDLWLGARQLTAGPAADSWPDWSPDGRRIVFSRREPGSRGSAIWVVRRDGGGLVRLTGGRETVDVMPAWSPDGLRIAYASSPVAGGSFDVFVVGARGGASRRAAGGPGDEIAPSWDAAGALRFQRLEPGGSWEERTRDDETPSLGPRELLPDFDQRAPFRLLVLGTQLAFASATDNVGEGPIWIRGARAAAEGPMEAVQLVRLSDGGVRTYPDAGRLRFAHADSHTHWHLLDFQRYELRRADDFSLVVRDRKSGFCLADHWGLAEHRVAGFGPPVFLGNCGQGEPDALRVEQGTSIGYTDLYPPLFHGQSLDLAGVPAGDYVLVHRANPEGLLEELDYGNDAASLRLRLTWADGRPQVDVLRTCPATERC